MLIYTPTYAFMPRSSLLIETPFSPNIPNNKYVNK